MSDNHSEIHRYWFCICLRMLRHLRLSAFIYGSIWAVFGLAALGAHAQQQPYPTRPLRIVMSFPAGGPTDILGRLLAQKLIESWGENVLIDNRPGGAGVIGAMAAVKSPPDGYTMYLGGIASMAIAPAVQKDLPYEPLRDFAPVTMTTISPLLLMTHPSLPAKTVGEFVALAKARPGQINYASSGPGGSGHLAGELFQSMTRVKLVHIPYRGAPPALNDLVAGHVQVMFGTMLASVPSVRNGKLRALAVTGPRRSNAVPEVPTFAEAGLPGYDASSWNGIQVPAATPRAIVSRLNAELVRVLRIPNVLDRLAADGPIPVGNTPEEYTAFIKAEQVKWARIVREANIRIE
jgi:tripartite-type tricarboxylate transporter receptor subunit TctC